MQAIITGAIAFATTNIDDIFVLIALFSQVNGQTLQIRHIVLGQYIGIMTLTILSIIGALGVLFIPTAWIGLLGFVPLYIGIKGLVALKRNKVDDDPDQEVLTVNEGDQKASFGKGKILFGASTLKVAAITIGNGGDNIAIYIPLFASGSLFSGAIMVALFLVLIGVWCYVGYKLVNFPFIAQGIQKYGKVVIPFVFIGLGVYILYHSGTFNIFIW